MKLFLILLGLCFLIGCAAGEPAATPTATPDTVVEAAERGQALFRNKGCVTCHVNRRVEGETGIMSIGAPDLSDYTNDADFLRRWLADPAAVRPGTRMPNLRLSPGEIEDLIAFLNEPR